MIISTLAELKHIINLLPPVADGYVRLFRGQNEEFGKILSSAHRGNDIEGRDQWNLYCLVLAKYLLRKEKDTSICDVDLLLYWIRALSQHYGPGTEFLDVTKSLDIGVWFALNRIEKSEAHSYSGPGNDIQPDDVFNVHEYFTYLPFEGNGYFYVLDIPDALECSVLENNTAIDISSNLASVFRKATRLKVQHASLVRCDKAINNGDCSEYLACEPIEIAPTCLQDLKDDYNVTKLFPLPERDEWYGRFISVPYSLYGSTQDGHLAGKRTLPVEFYSDIDNPDYLYSILNRVTTRTNFFPYLSYIPQKNDDKKMHAGAVPILFSNPIMATSPNVDSGEWHEELLWLNANLVESNASIKTVPSFIHGTDINSFVEFSPLEVGNWLEIDNNIESEAENIRSIWIRSYEQRILKIVLFVDGHNTKGAVLEAELWLDEEKREIMIKGKSSLKLSDSPLAKPVYTVLAMLGDWFPGLKIKPIPSITIDDDLYLIYVTDKTVKIEPVMEVPGTDRLLCGVFNLETGMAYKSVTEHFEDALVFKMKSAKNYASIPFNELATQYNEQCNS